MTRDLGLLAKIVCCHRPVMANALAMIQLSFPLSLASTARFPLMGWIRNGVAVTDPDRSRIAAIFFCPAARHRDSCERKNGLSANRCSVWALDYTCAAMSSERRFRHGPLML